MAAKLVFAVVVLLLLGGSAAGSVVDGNWAGAAFGVCLAFFIVRFGLTGRA